MITVFVVVGLSMFMSLYLVNCSFNPSVSTCYKPKLCFVWNSANLVTIRFPCSEVGFP